MSSDKLSEFLQRDDYSSEYLDRGIRHYHNGNLVLSAAHLEQAVAAAEQTDDVDQELLARNNLCEAYTRLGRTKDAIECAGVLLAKARRHDLRERQGDAIVSLNLALQSTELVERWHEMMPLLLEGIAIAREVGDHYNETMIMEIIGTSAIRLGELEDGATWLNRALNSLDQVKNESDFFRTRISMGLAEYWLKRGNGRRAVEYADLAVSIASSMQQRSIYLETCACIALADVEHANGNHADALAMLQRVKNWVDRNEWPVERCRAETLMAIITLKLGDAQRSIDHSRVAMTTATGIRLLDSVAAAELALAAALYATGCPVEAATHAAAGTALARGRGLVKLLGQYSDLPAPSAVE